MSISWVCPGCLKSVSRMFQGGFRDILRMFEECLKEECLKGVPQECFKGVSRMFKGVSRMFQGCLNGSLGAFH